jgi:hypothetical protein
MTEFPTRLEQLTAALAGRYHLERVLGEGGAAVHQLTSERRLSRFVYLMEKRGGEAG